MNPLAFRQIHLDFHTSEQIAGVADEFDARGFAETLRAAHVNSVTLFARCHHGMIYYDSKRDPERVHPGLGGKDLLRMQIDACRAAGIRTPVYTSVQWDAYSAKTHPEWVSRDAEGRAVGEGFGKVQRPFEAGFYSTMCLNTPYRDFLRGHIEEILDTFDPVDGLFLDIVNPVDCSCPACVEKMRRLGLDPAARAMRHRRRHTDAAAVVLCGPGGEEDINMCIESTLLYTNPASDWETQALPIGNGRLGAMIFGGVATDQIQFNEETLYTGRPGEADAQAHKTLPAIRRLLSQKQYAQAQELVDNSFLDSAAYGTASDFGLYQNFGTILVTLHDSDESECYRRTLDMKNGVARVSYTRGSAQYDRTYIASHPADLIAVHYAIHDSAAELNATISHHEIRRPVLFEHALGKCRRISRHMPCLLARELLSAGGCQTECLRRNRNGHPHHRRAVHQLPAGCRYLGDRGRFYLRGPAGPGKAPFSPDRARGTHPGMVPGF